MTLVVARLAGRHVVIASDLRVTDPDEVRRGYPYGVLKAITISPDVCIAFANSVDEALDAIGDLPRPTSSEAFSEITAALAHRTSRASRTAEFLVASSNPPRLAVVRHGATTQGSVAWIGDRGAFAEFQRIALDPDQPRPAASGSTRPDLDLVASITSTMTELIRLQSHVSVGEAGVFLRTNDAGSFEYLTAALLVGSGGQMIPPNQETALNFGSASTGGFGYSVLTPTETGVAAVGLFFPHGRVGLLYAPLLDRYPFSYTDVGHDEFRARVRSNHGFDVEGAMIS